MPVVHDSSAAVAHLLAALDTLAFVPSATGNPDVIGTSGFSALAAPPVSIAPNDSGAVEVEFSAPTVPGSVSQLYTLASDDASATIGELAASHNAQVNLVAEIGELEIGLVLDASGSMMLKPDGTPTADPAESRLSFVKSATSYFITLLGHFGDNAGRFGVAVFPNVPGVTTGSVAGLRAGHLLAGEIQNITVPNLGTTLDTAIESLTPVNSTPMGDGIALAMGESATIFRYFRGDQNSKDFNRRLMVLLSDGFRNAGTHLPDDFFDSGTGISFSDKNVVPFTVAYSTEDSIGEIQLSEIAAQSPEGLHFISADADDTVLEQGFKDALVVGLDLDSPSDPRGTLTAGSPEVRREVIITPFDSKLAFTVNWVSHDAGRLNVRLMTPDCELITPTVAQSNPDINFYSEFRHQIYTVDDNYLRNATNPANPRHGVWTIILTAPGLSGTD